MVLWLIQDKYISIIVRHLFGACSNFDDDIDCGDSSSCAGGGWISDIWGRLLGEEDISCVRAIKYSKVFASRWKNF